ncbi:MAG: 50S ribosomal protein L4 [Candidatus Levybacteria bacterium]|nr:50S ribosomal protein L4 [Candidatus Levybacteria bacterium]
MPAKKFPSKADQPKVEKVAKKSAKLDLKKELKSEVKFVKKEVKSVSKLNADVFDVKGKVIGKVSLPQEIFGAKINKVLLSQAVRVYLANQRLGTAKTKDRGEVHGTTKKVWQQKGTGRARHGSRKAPIFVHGGIAFGPRPRDFSLKLSKKMRKQALFSAFSSRVKDRQLRIVAGLEKIKPKTKVMVGTFKDLGIKDKEKILLITPSKGGSYDNVYRSARNIEGVQILASNILNAYEVLDNNLVIVMRDAINSIKDNFLRER